MGAQYLFTCSQCDYTAQVNRGPDCGFNLETKTKVCKDCLEVVDVTVKISPYQSDFDENQDYTNKCPLCKGSNFAVWKKTWSCPKCDGRMKKGDLVIFWD